MGSQSNKDQTSKEVSLSPEPAKVVKTEQEIVAEIMVKAIFSGYASLTADEKVLYSKHAAKVSEATKDAKKDSETVKKQLAEDHKTEVENWLVGFSSKINALSLLSKEITDGKTLKTQLTDLLKDMPVLKGSGSKGHTSSEVSRNEIFVSEIGKGNNTKEGLLKACKEQYPGPEKYASQALTKAVKEGVILVSDKGIYSVPVPEAKK
jgi:hypothetical protein